jgi:hypothetical protein
VAERYLFYLEIVHSQVGDYAGSDLAGQRQRPDTYCCRYVIQCAAVPILRDKCPFSVEQKKFLIAADYRS